MPYFSCLNNFDIPSKEELSHTADKEIKESDCKSSSLSAAKLILWRVSDQSKIITGLLLDILRSSSVTKLTTRSDDIDGNLATLADHHRTSKESGNQRVFSKRINSIYRR